MKFRASIVSLLATGASLPYTASQTISCPPANAPPVPLATSPTAPTTVRIPIISASDGLCILSRHDTLTLTDKQRAPVARSYASRDWEKTAGLYAKAGSGVTVDCSAGSVNECDVTLPALENGKEYILTSYEYGGDAR